MKKIFTIAVLLFTAITISAADRYYNCGIKSVEIKDDSYTGKHIFVVTITQTAKNRAEYTGNNQNVTYDATVKLSLTSDDGTLEGTYTTEGFVSIGSTYDKNYINTGNTEVNVTGKSPRRPHPNYVSTFVINKDDENLYSIGECALYVTDVQLNPQNLWCYYYSYDVDEINTQGISQKPYEFYYSSEYVTSVYNYDLTPNSFNVVRDDTDYEGKRYFLTIGCSGKCRETNDERNYEVQLAIYPDEANIAGSYATQGGAHLLWSQNSYVKDLQITKQRNLANDSVSSVSIVSKGNDKYTLTGGPLICTDVDLNYQAVYGKKRIEAVRYYYFNDNGGEGIDFTYNEETGESGIATGIDNTPFPSGEGRGEALKLFRNGQLLIERNGLYYNMQGTVIR